MVHSGSGAVLIAAVLLLLQCSQTHAWSRSLVHHQQQQQQQQQQQPQQQPQQRQQLQTPSMMPNTPTNSKECGTPYALCGLSIPKTVTCTQGPGWCQPGYYCGAAKGPPPLQPPRCLPIPKDCGMAGKPCCPSNSVTPHTDESDIFRPAFCKDGSVCFEYGQKGNVVDWYKGNTGDYLCTMVPSDCGSAVGKACCPLLWRMATNPPLDHTKEGCWAKGLRCQADVALINSPAGRGVPNTPGTCVPQ